VTQKVWVQKKFFLLYLFNIRLIIGVVLALVWIV